MTNDLCACLILAVGLTACGYAAWHLARRLIEMEIEAAYRFMWLTWF